MSPIRLEQCVGLRDMQPGRDQLQRSHQSGRQSHRGCRFSIFRGTGASLRGRRASGKFLFVVNRQSNQISEYKIATGTGVLTANTQATISTGLNPVWATTRKGTTVVTTTGGITDFLYRGQSRSILDFGLQLRFHGRPARPGRRPSNYREPTLGSGCGIALRSVVALPCPVYFAWRLLCLKQQRREVR